MKQIIEEIKKYDKEIKIIQEEKQSIIENKNNIINNIKNSEILYHQLVDECFQIDTMKYTHTNKRNTFLIITIILSIIDISSIKFIINYIIKSSNILLNILLFCSIPGIITISYKLINPIESIKNYYKVDIESYNDKIEQLKIEMNRIKDNINKYYKELYECNKKLNTKNNNIKLINEKIIVLMNKEINYVMENNSIALELQYNENQKPIIKKLIRRK